MQDTFIQPYHTHNSVDGTPNLDEDTSVINTRRFILYRIVGDATNTAVNNVQGGYLVMPFDGYILDNGVGATVDTAGVTGLTTIDINNGANPILTTKITIDSGETSSRTATNLPVLKPNMKQFVIGDRFSFDVDTIQSGTAAKGLTIFMNVVKTS